MKTHDSESRGQEEAAVHDKAVPILLVLAPIFATLLFLLYTQAYGILAITSYAKMPSGHTRLEKMKD